MIIIDKGFLKTVLLEWETNTRVSPEEFKTDKDTILESADSIAEQNTNYLWGLMLNHCNNKRV